MYLESFRTHGLANLEEYRCSFAYHCRVFWRQDFSRSFLKENWRFVWTKAIRSCSNEPRNLSDRVALLHCGT